MTRVRCAIYTRKSSEEGLEQNFNSLDAQREACAAYIQSQASEGWSLIDAPYDDGGTSGGTMKRPALQRLLKDIRSGKIDIVVVYKVDRLTRSLLDFARLVETFDTAEVSFVSVTQSFNTTTSMGRLTLNMLLSFAQFEREVTAECIRDKISASKAKGMWMGGIPPLGYEPDGRSLKIVEPHADLIRSLFRGYLELGNVRPLFEKLEVDGARIPERVLSTGKRIGGAPFTRGQIYKILSNSIYVGEIHHHGKVYNGQHQAIIDRELWDAVRARVEENRQGEQRAATIKSPSLLAGKVFDEAGQPLVASHACKGKVRYRYYVSRALQHDAGSTMEGWRIPANELESAVIARLTEALGQPLGLLEQIGGDLVPGNISSLSRGANELVTHIRKKRAAAIQPLIERIVIAPDRLTITIDGKAMLTRLGIGQAGDLRHPELVDEMKLTRTGRAIRLIQANGRTSTTRMDDTLIRLVLRGDGLVEGALGMQSDHLVACSLQHARTSTHLSYRELSGWHFCRQGSSKRSSAGISPPPSPLTDYAVATYRFAGLNSTKCSASKSRNLSMGLGPSKWRREKVSPNPTDVALRPFSPVPESRQNGAELRAFCRAILSFYINTLCVAEDVVCCEPLSTRIPVFQPDFPFLARLNGNFASITVRGARGSMASR